MKPDYKTWLADNMDKLDEEFSEWMESCPCKEAICNMEEDIDVEYAEVRDTYFERKYNEACDDHDEHEYEQNKDGK